MNIKLIVIASSVLAFSAVAEQTNELPRGHDELPVPEGRRREGRSEPSSKERADMHERRLQLMEKTLKEIGVTEEQQQKINEMQLKHREEMKIASKATNEARERLSSLERSGASEDEIFAAIDAVSIAQAEQMKILARNKISMERVLGKEKYRQFMDAARSQYRQHGRRGGAGMPPRPGLPPIPGETENEPQPPMPDRPDVP